MSSENEKENEGDAASESGPGSTLQSADDGGISAAIRIAPAHGPYTKGLPIASVGGSLYPIEGPALIEGLYNKTRAKKLIHQLNAAHAAATSHRCAKRWRVWPAYQHRRCPCDVCNNGRPSICPQCRIPQHLRS